MSLEHWQTEDAFTLHEAACLIVGLDPLAKLPAQHENEGKLALLCRQLDRDYRHEASQLIDAVLRHFHPDSEEDPQLHSPNSISWITKMHDGIRSKNYELARKEVITSACFTDITCASDVEDLCYPIEQQRFTREEVASWCIKKGWQSKFDFSDKGQAARWHDESDAALATSLEKAEVVAPAAQTADTSQRAKNNYEALITAMAKKHYQYDAADAKSEVPAKLEKLLESEGISLSAQTIRMYLRSGATRLGKQK